MAEKKIAINTFSGGMNTVTARELLPNDQVEYMLNCDVLSAANGNVGIVTNIKGNVLIETPLKEGENKCIGWVADEEKNNFYFAVWNSNGYHTWYRFNAIDRKVTKILQDLTDTGGIQIFKWKKENLITHADIVRNNLLYWTVEGDEARKFNIDKALDKSLSGYGEIILEEYTRAYKKTANKAPSAVYFSDTTKPFNRLYGYQFKFVQRFIYDDNEKSNWSDISNVPLPENEPFTGIKTIPTNNNGIKITLETGSHIVNQIEVAMMSTAEEGGTYKWVSIAFLDKQKLGISSNSSYTYSFYNDGAYPATPDGKIIRPYSFLPKQPLCQAFVKNAMVYANFKEGFTPVTINVDAGVTYDDLFIDDGTDNKYNQPSLIVNETNVYFEKSGFGGWRHTVCTVTIGSDVKRGNKFEIYGKNGQSDNVHIPYMATLLDNATSVANQLRSLFIANSRFKNVSALSTDSGGNVSFNFDYMGHWNENYTKFSGYVNPVQFNSLKDTGQSVSNIKLGSSIKFGIIYEDEDGRKSLTYTNDGLIVKIDPINSLKRWKSPIISLAINHKPPVWAKSYQIVRSRDLIYNNYIQMLVQKVIEITATSTNENYLDLVMGSLFTYQKLHENTVLKYSFTKGDRIRLIKKINLSTSPVTESYYDFYETEIISYKDYVKQQKNENITVNGTDTVTVISASKDNIGSFLIVNGIEREIIDAPTGSTYRLSNTISGGGSNGTDPLRYGYYEIVNNNGVLRIKKPSTPDISDFSVVEIFSPSLTGDALGVKQFFEFGYKFPIINWGTADRAHSGNMQNQDTSVPAIVKIDKGTAYVRNREMPTNNITPNTQVVITSIEDPSYSDYYVSNLTDNGRENAEDTGDGEVFFGSRFRFSNNFIEDTRINGLNDFNNTDREDYNDKYGDVKRIVFDEGKLYVFKELRVGWIPVYKSVISDASGQEMLTVSKNLLNQLQYFARAGGIGRNPEAYCSNDTYKYYASANSGAIIRLALNGEIPISEIYQLDNKVRGYLQTAHKNGSKIYLEFDRVKGQLIVSFEESPDYLFAGQFDTNNWKLYDDKAPDGSVYNIVTNPSHGTLDLTDPLQPVYTPNHNYIGPDSFTYSTVVNGITIQKKVCIAVNDIDQDYAWRVKESSHYCILGGEYNLRTGYKGWTTLEEYGTFDKQLTGNEKPNTPGDEDYAAPVYDDQTCEPEQPDPVPDPYSFENKTDVNTSTVIESDIVEINGINIPSPVSIINGEFSINGEEWTSGDSTIKNGESVKVRVLSSANYSTPSSTTITIGGIPATFTVVTKAQSVIACGVSSQYDGGEAFPQEDVITLGSGDGIVVLEYDAYGIPEKFEVWFDGVKVIDTGYRGDSGYQTSLNSALAAKGLPAETIQGPGAGTASFTKNTATPTATVRVYAPMAGTAWTYKLKCPATQTITNTSNGATAITVGYRKAGTTEFSNLAPGQSVQVPYQSVDIKIQDGWSNVQVYINGTSQGGYSGTKNFQVPIGGLIEVGTKA